MIMVFNIILNKLDSVPHNGLLMKTIHTLIILTLTWKSAGSTMLIYLATIQSIDIPFMKLLESSVYLYGKDFDILLYQHYCQILNYY